MAPLVLLALLARMPSLRVRNRLIYRKRAKEAKKVKRTMKRAASTASAVARAVTCATRITRTGSRKEARHEGEKWCPSSGRRLVANVPTQKARVMGSEEGLQTE